VAKSLNEKVERNYLYVHSFKQLWYGFLYFPHCMPFRSGATTVQLVLNSKTNKCNIFISLEHRHKANVGCIDLDCITLSITFW